MTQFLISLDELERVKKVHHIDSTVELSERTGVSRSTWGRVLKTRRPTGDVIQALATLGANPSRILIAEDTTTAAA